MQKRRYTKGFYITHHKDFHSEDEECSDKSAEKKIIPAESENSNINVISTNSIYSVDIKKRICDNDSVALSMNTTYKPSSFRSPVTVYENFIPVEDTVSVKNTTDVNIEENRKKNEKVKELIRNSYVSAIINTVAAGIATISILLALVFSIELFITVFGIGLYAFFLAGLFSLLFYVKAKKRLTGEETHEDLQKLKFSRIIITVTAFALVICLLVAIAALGGGGLGI